MTPDEEKAYIVDGRELARVKRIVTRLYAGKTVSYDARREMAAILDHMLDGAMPVDYSELDDIGVLP